jgi:predicted nucleotidyltransferase
MQIPPVDLSSSPVEFMLLATGCSPVYERFRPPSPEWMPMFLTVAQRGEREAKRRTEAAEFARASLSEHARRLGGRYILYGSAARGTMGRESDLDILLDFPSVSEAEAWRAAEAVCREHDMPLDIMPMAWTEPGFVEKVLREGVVLG